MHNGDLMTLVGLVALPGCLWSGFCLPPSPSQPNAHTLPYSFIFSLLLSCLLEAICVTSHGGGGGGPILFVLPFCCFVLLVSFLSSSVPFYVLCVLFHSPLWWFSLLVWPSQASPVPWDASSYVYVLKRVVLSHYMTCATLWRATRVGR